jgi:hypothetical protein
VRSGYFRALLIAGLIARLACLRFAGTGDVEVWKTWSYGASERIATMYGVGGQPPERGVVVWGSRRMTVDYPPGALYGLAIVGRAYRAIDPAFTGGVALTVLVKLSILVADVVLCWSLWRLMRRYSPAAGRCAVLLYWLNPAAMLDGAVLGYLDPWFGALVIAALAAIDRAAFAQAGVALGLAVMTKLQAIFAIPVFALMLVHRGGPGWLHAAGSAGVAAGATMAVLLAPFAWVGALANVRQGVGSLLRHDMLSAEAANGWWIVTWLLRASYAVADFGAWAAWTMRLRIIGISRVTALGYPNPRPIAAVAAGAVILWAFWRARLASPAIVLAAGALAVHAHFVLQVQVHENHLYLAIPLMAAAAAVLPRLRGPFYLVSAVFFLNLYLFYGFGRDFPLPSRAFTIVDATVVLSFVNLGALVWHARRFSQEAAHPPAVDLDRGAAHV